MIELYGMASPNVTKISLMLAETELPYRFHYVNVFAEEQFEPGFLRNNPNHKVPVLIDPDGPGGASVTLFESGAILLYLGEKTGKLLPPPADPARYEVIKWMMIQLTGFGPMCGQYVHFSNYAPGNNGYALERYRKEVMRLYRLLDGRLAECEYLGGDDYSIADITMYPWAALHDYQKLSWDGLGNLQRWFDRVSERPAVARVMGELPALMQRGGEDMKAATPEGVARFLGQQLENSKSREQ